MNESTAELDAKYKIEISSTATRTDPVVGISWAVSDIEQADGRTGLPDYT